MVFEVLRGAYGNNPADHFNSLARRRIAYMALQFGLGLLSERRIRADFTHHNHIADYGTDITRIRIFLRQVLRRSDPFLCRITNLRIGSTD